MKRLSQDDLNEILRQHKPIWHPWRNTINEKRRTNLQNVDLENFDLSGVDLSGANLIGSNLRGVDFSGAKLIGARLWRADLQGANLEESYLGFADLESANLEGANLTKALLLSTSLHKANLSNASLFGANLHGSNLCYTIGNDQEILTVHTGDYHVNITDYQVWIDRRRCPWEIWLKLSDSQFINAFQGSRYISNIDHIIKEKTLNWWHHWKPELSRIIEERKQQREAVNTDSPITLVPGP